MQKTYEGYDSFNSTPRKVVVEWMCPHCHSKDVWMEEDEVFKKARWCDGDVTTHDRFGRWTCNDCKLVERGSRMIQQELSREDIFVKYEKREPSIIDDLLKVYRNKK